MDSLFLFRSKSNKKNNDQFSVFFERKMQQTIFDLLKIIIEPG